MAVDHRPNLPARRTSLRRLACATGATGAALAGTFPAIGAHAMPDTRTATGTFEVQLSPQGEADASDGNQLGLMLLNKRFSGDLQGTGAGRMLTGMTATRGSAGYVAIERVTGTLQGRSGSFVFQHSGSMDRGAQQLSITVVPDSGTGELTGLRGQFSIQIEGGVHRYRFEYTLP